MENGKKYLTSETDLYSRLKKAEELTKRCFGRNVELLKIFDIPEYLPWSSVIPVFDPGHLTNRDLVNVLKELGQDVYEEVDVLNYDGSEQTGYPTLQIINNSSVPSLSTIGKPMVDLYGLKDSLLRMRGYALALAFVYFDSGEHLDQETYTVFPYDRWGKAGACRGYWRHHLGKVCFDWHDIDTENAKSAGAERTGARIVRNAILR